MTVAEHHRVDVVTTVRHHATFLFTDIVGSTELLSLLGEETWLEALREHNTVVLETAERSGGDMMKFLGDGWMVTFGGPQEAVDAAIAIQRAHAGSGSGEGFRVRIGVHTGSAIEERDDLVGRDVVLASRIAQQAGPSEIVVSADVVDVLGCSDPFDGGRIAHLKGLGPHLVFGVDWA